MKRTPLIVLLALSFSGTVIGQLPQRRPDFCGTPGVLVPLPRNVSAISYPEKGYSDLFVRDGATAVRLDTDEVIDQVCELPEDRIVVFGNSGAYGTNISIVDMEKAVLVDTFLVYDPRLSPNRRWIAYRKFYPRQSDLRPSDEYLLYDLSKSPHQNRPSEPFSLGPNDMDVGSPIYPLGWKNESGDNLGAPDGQRHGHKSPFFWAPDSRAIVFTDIFQEDKADVVLVTINDEGATTASIYPYSAMECKGEDAKAMSKQAQPAVEFGPQQGTDLPIFLKFQSAGCTPMTLQLRRDSFRPAKRENRVIEKPTHKTIKGK
jgi:hypothetical protein